MCYAYQAGGRASENRHRELVRPEVSPSAATLDRDGRSPAGVSAGGVFCTKGCLEGRAYGHPRSLPGGCCKQLSGFVIRSFL